MTGRALTAAERQLLAWAAEEPLARDEDPEAVDALVAGGLLVQKDDVLFDDLQLFVLTDPGRVALANGALAARGEPAP